MTPTKFRKPRAAAPLPEMPQLRRQMSPTSDAFALGYLESFIGHLHADLLRAGVSTRDPVTRSDVAGMASRIRETIETINAATSTREIEGAKNGRE